MSGISLGRSRHPRGEGSVCSWLPRISLKSGWEWGPTFTSPDPEMNTTFQEDNARAETSPPFPLHPKESCCRAVNIFITYLQTLHLMSSQIFSSFVLSQARDIHARGVGGTCAHTFDIPFQAFLNGAPASPCLLNTQILLKTHGYTGCGRDWHKHSQFSPQKLRVIGHKTTKIPRACFWIL